MSDTSAPSPAPATPGRGTQTRAKLVSLTVLANLAGFVIAVWVARTLRGSAVSETMQSVWLAVYYGSMFVVAIFDAFLVDELVFGGSFRRQYLKGEDSRQLERSGADEKLAASFKRHRMSFPVVAIICGALTYFLFNLVNNDFDTYYSTVGKHLSDLRSDDAARQNAAVIALSIRRDAPVLPALIRTVKAEGSAAPAAAWALGRFHDLPTKRPVILPLVGATRSSNPAVRREALVALGRLQHRPMAVYVLDELKAQRAAGEAVDHRLLYALGSLQVMDAVPVLESLLHEADEDTQRMAAWALAQHRDQVNGRAVVEVLEQRLPSATLPVRCAIVHALGILGDEHSNRALMQAYDDSTPDEQAFVCPRIMLPMGPEGADDTVELLRPERKFGMKIIMSMGQMRASSPEIRALVEPWLMAISADQTAIYEVREGGNSLLKGIREGRNDAETKTVDEALGIEQD